MNKHLNNWLDKQEGLPKETTNKKIIREMARQGVLASVNKRLGGKTQSEISQVMRTIRMSNLTKKESKEFEKSAQGMVDNLNKNVKQ